MSARTLKISFLLLLGCFLSIPASSQRYAYVDTEYILENIPDYQEAQKKLDELAKQWEKEIQKQYEEIDKLYRSLEAEEVLLTDEMKQKRQREIMQKEKAVRELQKQRFGKKGDLFQKRKELIHPIQDRIYSQIKELAKSQNYMVIFNTSDRSNILYADERYDKSEDILKKLGYEPGKAQMKNKEEQKE